MQQQMTQDEQNARNMRDFLLVYNKITEYCFRKCVHNMNISALSKEEVACVEQCSSKNVGINNRIMQRFIDIQVDKQKAMVKELTEAQQQAQNTEAVNPPAQQSAPEINSVNSSTDQTAGLTPVSSTDNAT